MPSGFPPGIALNDAIRRFAGGLSARSAAGETEKKREMRASNETMSPWWTPDVHADRRPFLLGRNAIQ
ncbi:EF-P lysine aminoacylase EpmA, partial [Rhizobium sp. BR5]